MKQLINRWKASSPKFWVNFRKLVTYIGSVALVLLSKTLPLTLPDNFYTICSYILVACIAMGFTAKLTKE